MRGFTKHLRNVSIASVSILFLLTCLALIPLSAAGAHERTLGVATPTTVTVQVTPTEDATVTALNKEQLIQQVAEQQHTWDNWLWSNAATFLSGLLSTLVVVIGVLFGFWQWRVGRNDAQKKESDDQKAVQDKELEDRKAEREKRAEERFQAAVTGLGDEKEGAQIGAAILLRTFLRPGYEQFYMQTFDLAVANLRLLRIPQPPEYPTTPLPLTTLRQALIVAFRESFPLARDLLEKNDQYSLPSLDATGIQLDNAYLHSADLKQAWLPQASLRKANLIMANLFRANLVEANLHLAELFVADLRAATLFKANLSGAGLSEANLNGAGLSGVDLGEAKLRKTKLRRTDLRKANLSGADLGEADLSEAKLCNVNLSRADLSSANLSGADLREVKNLESVLSFSKTNLRGVTGLTREQLAVCKVKGAIIDEDSAVSSPQSTVALLPPSQSNDAQVSLASSAQESTPPPDPDGSTTTSSQQEPES